MLLEEGVCYDQCIKKKKKTLYFLKFIQVLLNFSAGLIFAMKVKVAQSCPPLCNPMDYTVHGTLQARILEWVTCAFSRGSSHPRDRTQVSCIAGGFFTSRATREALLSLWACPNSLPKSRSEFCNQHHFPANSSCLLAPFTNLFRLGSFPRC